MKSIRSFLAAGLIALAVAGCSPGLWAPIQTGINAAAGATVDPQAIYIARNVFDGLEVTATRYLRLPKCRATSGTALCRSPAATVHIIPAVKSGRAARNAATAFLKSHPGQLGLKGDYDAMTASIDVLRVIFQQYNVN